MCRRRIEACHQGSGARAAHSGISKAITTYVCGLTAACHAHEHVRRVLNGRASAAWCRCGLRRAETPRRTPVTFLAAAAVGVSEVSKSFYRKSGRRGSGAETCTWPFACATGSGSLARSVSQSVCLLVVWLGRTRLLGLVSEVPRRTYAGPPIAHPAYDAAASRKTAAGGLAVGTQTRRRSIVPSCAQTRSSARAPHAWVPSSLSLCSLRVWSGCI